MKKFLFWTFILLNNQIKSQTQFYFQDFENSSNPSGLDWTFSHTTVSGNNNYWVWDSGTAGATTGAATYQGTGALQVWRRVSAGGGSWSTDYGNHANTNRTVQKTFDFSSISLGSDINLSFWLLCKGELATNGIYYDYFEVEINGNTTLGPVVNINTWSLQNIDLSSYAGNSAVTVTFRWRNDGSVANQPAARVDNVLIEYTEYGPLPVTLTSFTTACNNGAPLLEWTTASEQNSDYFQVEKSLDGTNWFEITRISALGNSSIGKNYQFRDIDTDDYFEGYYRLKQVDFDGSFEYFGPTYVLCQTYKTQLSFEVFPNPVINEVFLKIKNNKQENINVVISDYTGKILTQTEIEINSGFTFRSIDLSTYRAGMYLLCIIAKDDKHIYKITKN
jgi:hypothetical protein